MRKSLRLLLVTFALAFAAGAAHAAGKILVFGDSLSSAYGIAERRGWVALLEERLEREKLAWQVVNASISGETTSGGRSRLSRALADHKPAVVVLELGGNDGLRGLPVAEMKKNLSAMVAQAQKAGARVLLVGMRVPPNYGETYTRAFERAFGEVAAERKVALLPFLFDGFGEKMEMFQPDRIHPNEAAQPAMLGNVWKALVPLLGKP
jgi:acyl-CoA thioesterase-1